MHVNVTLFVIHKLLLVLHVAMPASTSEGPQHRRDKRGGTQAANESLGILSHSTCPRAATRTPSSGSPSRIIFSLIMGLPGQCLGSYSSQTPLPAQDLSVPGGTPVPLSPRKAREVRGYHDDRFSSKRRGPRAAECPHARQCLPSCVQHSSTLQCKHRSTAEFQCGPKLRGHARHCRNGGVCVRGEPI